MIPALDGYLKSQLHLQLDIFTPKPSHPAPATNNPHRKRQLAYSQPCLSFDTKILASSAFHHLYPYMEVGMEVRLLPAVSQVFRVLPGMEA